MVEYLKRLAQKDPTIKTKAEIREIVLVEKEYNNLKQRADELEVQLNYEHEQNTALMQGRSTKMQETASEKTTLLSNKESATNTSRHVERSNKNEAQQNYHLEVVDHNDGKSDASRSTSSKFGWFQNNSSSKELPIQRASSSASRKPAKDDLIGAKNDNSTFSKLITRLNYLKERHNQIASELENIDKGHSSSSRHNSGHTKAPEPLQINCCG
ncbi:hypothetical protein Cgig2_025037 [Carnegiea gigantea]|uniref:Uncharacterized protein n=1 Tax=Carnegiea gigantea TaxID=171969 RepID=A0A9Q1QAU1_9CARY|nr:hypothetical protein Cgig2_025037 [Carnegiea gigantea]